MPKTVNVGFEEFIEDNVQELTKTMPWMKDTDMQLCTGIEHLRQFIDKAISNSKDGKKAVCAVDFETTGLNTRMIKGKPAIDIVGICLATDKNTGIYIPVNHKEGSEMNIPEAQVLEEIRRLCKCCIILVHNAKFDLSVLRNFGIVIDNFEDFEDTLILARLYDAGQKAIGLKELSKKLLDRPMIELKDITRGSHRLDMVSPKIGYIYGASDALCTFGLFELFNSQQIINEQRGIYNLEKRLVFVVMQMEANLVLIDREYLLKEKARITERLDFIKSEIHRLADDKEFNIGSTQQLGKILFEKLNYEYPSKTKTASGQYMTDTATLEKISDKYPMVKLIIECRELEKSLGTYIENLLNNCDEDGCVKVSFNQNGTDTGRFSSPGGHGINIDGYSAVNVQSIPANYSASAPDIRKAFKARPGNKIVAMDFSGEELRVATNLSLEPKWIEELLHGSADLHTATGKAIYKKEEISKAERQVSKTINFLVLYGGGSRGLAEQARLSETEARRILSSFFEGLPKLRKWIERERATAKRQKFARSSFGRVRPLHMFYDSGDRGLEAHADRCATNFLVQGCLKSTERVLTDKGYLPIIKVKELQDSGISMKVWTGTSWESFDVVNRGPWQMATLELHNGMKLECDTRHEVLTVGHTDYEFKKFEDLTEETGVCVPIPTSLQYGSWPECPFIYYKNTVHNRKPLRINTLQDWVDIAYILGYIIGDGTINNIQDPKNRRWSYSAAFCFGKEKLTRNYEKLKKRFKKFGLNLGNPQLQKNAKGESYKATCNSASFIQLLNDFGYDYSQKRIPQKIFSCPIEMRLSFLKGYFDTDGSKKEENRYNFHTPNKELLQDVQLLAWSLGAASRIYTENTGAYLLNWECLQDISRILGLSCSTRYKYRGRDMILPKFMHQKILQKLSEITVPFTNAEKALIRKLKKGMNVSTQSMAQFLKNHNCDLPQMYYYYRVKSKVVHDYQEDTYTLSVHSPLHRFESAGIISKNTCADIMKVVMVRIASWIKENNLENEIKILLTMHDELVFEMPENKLELYIPQLNNIMCLSDILQGTFKWPVPLTVDAEYGDTWHVDHDLFKEKPELKNSPVIEFHQPTQVIEKEVAPAAAPGPAPEAQAMPELTMGPDLQMPEVPVPAAVTESLTLDNTEKNGPLEMCAPAGAVELEEITYKIRDRSKTTLLKLNQIITFLTEDCENKMYSGPVKILKVFDKEGYVLSVSNLRVRADAFYALARFECI